MNKFSWEEILKNNEDIQLIGYGSLLNNNTHHCEHKTTPVIFFGFKRIYNYRACPENPCEKWRALFKEYLKKYNIIDENDFENHIKNPPCVLNCIPTGNKNDTVNGLCMDIPAHELEKYSIREKDYDLIETEYQIVCPETGKTNNCFQTAYVLTAKDSAIYPEWKPFLAYHNNTRNGAYNLWSYFGKMFDETTFCNEWKYLHK